MKFITAPTGRRVGEEATNGCQQDIAYHVCQLRTGVIAKAGIS